jgi:hypothetical protein
MPSNQRIAHSPEIASGPKVPEMGVELLTVFD